MSEDPRERIAHIRGSIISHTTALNGLIREAAFAINDFDEEIDRVYGRPRTDSYSSPSLFRFDRALRHFIRLLVHLKVQMHRYHEATRPLEQLMATLTRGSWLHRHVTLDESLPRNFSRDRREHPVMDDSAPENPRASLNDVDEESRPL